MFGNSVQFAFKGRSKVFSVAGILISCLVMILFTIFLVVRTIKLVNKIDPILMKSVMNEPDVVIDLWDLGYFFAVSVVDPRIGTVKV